MKEKRGRPTTSKLSLVRTIRNAMGLSVKELADLANADYYTIQRIELNRTIGPERVYKLSKALNIHSDIIFYSMGQFPEDKIDFARKDPLKFKEAIDELCAEPWRLTTTEDYIKNIEDKINKPQINPEIAKMLSKLKPSE